jgi:excisionase family DNA binding protein
MGRDRPFTTRELADRLGWTTSQISEMCRAGLIRAVKVKGRWQIPREEGERLLAMGPLDRKILAVEASISRSRLVRIASGRATKNDWFWFGVGFGRGRYAIGRLMVLSLYLAYLKVRRAIATRRNR